MKGKAISPTLLSLFLLLSLPIRVFGACGVTPFNYLWADVTFNHLDFTTGPSYVPVPPYPTPVPYSTLILQAGYHYAAFTNLTYTPTSPNSIQWVTVDMGNNGIWGSAYAVHSPTGTYCVNGGCNTTTIRPDSAWIILNTNIAALGATQTLYANQRRETTVRHELGHLFGMAHEDSCLNLMNRFWTPFMPNGLDATQINWLNSNY